MGIFPVGELNHTAHSVLVRGGAAVTTIAIDDRASLWVNDGVDRVRPTIRTVRDRVDLDAAAQVVGPHLIDDADAFAAPHGRLLIAFLAGEVVGAAGVRRLASDPRRPGGHLALVAHLTVLAGARGRGIGTSLLGRAMAGAYWLGCDTLRVEGDADDATDERLRRFLERSGFRVVVTDQGTVRAQRPIAAGPADRLIA
jgi:GNAT superfamily N-acetyltransferase